MALLLVALMSFSVFVSINADADTKYKYLPPEATQQIDDIFSKPEEELNQMAEQMMSEFQKEFNLSPEEMDEFNKFLEELATEIATKAEEEGKDIKDYLLDQLNEGAKIATEEIAKVESTPASTAKPTIEPPVNIDKQTQIKRILSRISQALNALRVFATDDQAIQEMFGYYSYTITDIIFFAESFQTNSVLAKLTNEKYDAFVKELTTFADSLDSLVAHIKPVQFSLEGETPYALLGLTPSATQEDIVTGYKDMRAKYDPARRDLELVAQGVPEAERNSQIANAVNQIKKIDEAYSFLRQREETLFAVQEIETLLEDSMSEKGLIQSFKTFLTSLDPEIAKAQKDREESEQEARQQQQEAARKRPVVRRMFDMPEPLYNSTSYFFDQPRETYQSVSVGGEVEQSPSINTAGANTSAQTSKDAPKASDENKTKKSDKDKSEKDNKKDGGKEDKNSPTKTAEVKSAKVSDEFDKLENRRELKELLIEAQKSVNTLSKKAPEGNLSGIAYFLTQPLELKTVTIAEAEESLDEEEKTLINGMSPEEKQSFLAERVGELQTQQDQAALQPVKTYIETLESLKKSLSQAEKIVAKLKKAGDSTSDINDILAKTDKNKLDLKKVYAFCKFPEILNPEDPKSFDEPTPTESDPNKKTSRSIDQAKRYIVFGKKDGELPEAVINLNKNSQDAGAPKNIIIEIKKAAGSLEKALKDSKKTSR